MDDETEVPPELLQRASGPVPEPPVESAAHVLPVGELSPTDLERLAVRIARLEGTPVRTRRYGVPGQKQYGIDVYSRMASGRYVTYQLKRYREVKASDISDAVKEFRDGRWAKRSERFVFATSANLDRTELEEEVETQTDALAALDPPVAFEVWDVEELSHRLRRHPDIVLEFFGPVWSRRFFGQPEVLGTSGIEIASAVKAALVESAAISLVSNDWAPPRLRPRLDELSKSDPQLYRQLAEQFGSPPEPPLVAAATLAPPPWLQTATDETWSLVARIAEALGEWYAAARAWERVASMRTGAAAAAPLTQAAIAANTGGDRAKYDELLEAAAAADEHNVRLILERLDEFTPPAEQLRLLDGLRSQDPEELGLIAARRALAHLLVPDTAAARAALDEVRKHLAPSLLVDELEVSIAVQEGRLAVLDHRTLDRGALLGAASKAAAVRDRLLEERRFSESTRMLMLIADTHALLGDRLKASKVLRTATPDERETQEQKEVLAQSAAGRALDAELALEFIEGAEETPTVLQVRLESLETTGTPAERQAALDGLDAIVRAGGASAPEAAFNRLAATLGSIPTPWSESAAEFLKANGHERAAVTAEVMYRVRRGDWTTVQALLAPYGQEPWALAAALRAALNPRVEGRVAAEAARAVLAIGPGHALRIDAARGLSRGREFSAAHETLMAVARDPNAPEVTRGDAYEQLMYVVGRDLEGWATAGRLYDEWVRLRPLDTRTHRWAPTIANRRRQGHS